MLLSRNLALGRLERALRISVRSRTATTTCRPVLCQSLPPNPASPQPSGVTGKLARDQEKLKYLRESLAKTFGKDPLPPRVQAGTDNKAWNKLLTRDMNSLVANAEALAAEMGKDIVAGLISKEPRVFLGNPDNLLKKLDNLASLFNITKQEIYATALPKPLLMTLSYDKLKLMRDFYIRKGGEILPPQKFLIKCINGAKNKDLVGRAKDLAGAPRSWREPIDPA